MSQLWDPEQTIEPDEALAIIGEQFPTLKPQKIALLGVGWDNTAYLINDVWVFRFPRREIAVALMEAESALLPKIAPLLPLPIPTPEWIGTPGEGFPWPFAGYRYLKGSTACRMQLTDKERFALAEPIAQFLVVLHSLPVQHYPLLPTDTIERLKVGRMMKGLKGRLEELYLLGKIEHKEPFLERLGSEDDYIKPTAFTLVHGDFYARHLLVDKRSQLTGVIDWGDIHRGDPAVDLAILPSFFPKAGQEIFRNVYGKISSETFKLAQLRALYSSCHMAVYGHHVQDNAIEGEGLMNIKRLLANWA